MTEAEWLVCEDPYAMIDLLVDGAPRPCSELQARAARYVHFRRVEKRDVFTKRKVRLFAVACCRRIWDLLVDPRSRDAVELGERYADGRAGEEELAAASARAEETYEEKYEQFLRARGPYADAEDAVRTTVEDGLSEWLGRGALIAADAAGYPDNASRVPDSARVQAEHRMQAGLLHDIFGTLPFRSVTADPSWLAWNAGTVVNLAQAIYDDRAFDRLPILADALEDAGCTNGDILEHCRGGGEHVRGCWVVDLLLGKG